MPHHEILALGLGEAGEFPVRNNMHWAVTLQGVQYVTSGKESYSEFGSARKDKNGCSVLHLRRPDTLAPVEVVVPDGTLRCICEECEKLEAMLGLRDFRFLYVPIFPDLITLLHFKDERWARFRKALLLLQERARTAELHNLRVTFNAATLLNRLRWVLGIGDLVIVWDAAVTRAAGTKESVARTWPEMIGPPHGAAIREQTYPHSVGGLVLRAWHEGLRLELFSKNEYLMSIDAYKGGPSFPAGGVSSADVVASLTSWLGDCRINIDGDGLWQKEALQELVDLLRLHFQIAHLATR